MWIGRLEVELSWFVVLQWRCVVKELFLMILWLFDMVNHVLLEHHELLEAQLISHRDTGSDRKSRINRLKRHIYGFY